MKPSHHAILAAASLVAAFAMAPAIAAADDQQPKEGGKTFKKHEREGKEGNPPRGAPQEKQQRQQGQPQGQQGNRGDQPGNPAFGEQRPPKNERRKDRNRPEGNPNAFKPPQNAPANNAVAPPPPQPPQNAAPQNAGPQNFNNQFGGQGKDKDRRKKHRDQQFGGGNQGGPGPQGAPPGPPPGAPQGAPPVNAAPVNRPAGNFNAPPPRKPQSADDAKRRFEAMRGQRKEVKFDNGKGVVIEEPGKRRIYRDNNRVFIQHDDTERLRRVAPNARFEKGKGGTNIAVIDRPGGYKVYSETDSNGQLLRRYRRGPDGRDVIIIDNRRRHRDNFGRNVAAGIGIGVGVVAGAAILNSILDVPPPRVRIPRDEYIVDYGRASDEDVYDALSAPPVEDFRDRYTLDEIRATAALRDRMRRVDLDDITFDFGSWEVDPSQYGKLDRIARAMQRVISRNPNEVFMIEGYTDAVGSVEDNLSLSDRRAESVAEVLTEQFRIPFENLTTQGYGEDFLKVPTQAPERLNRRVAVRRITPLLARDGGPPPPQGQGAPQRSYDDGPGPGGPNDGGSYDDGPGDNGPGDNGQGYDDRGYDDRRN